MSSGVYVVIVALALLSEKCNSLRVNSKNGVDDKFQKSVLDLDPVQYAEPLKTDKEYDESIPEDFGGINEYKHRGVTREESGKYEDFAAQTAKQRKKRQTQHGYTSLYPQVPSAPPYSYNSNQPNYYPSGQNPAYKPASNAQYPQQWNPNLMNNSHSGYPSPQNYNPHNSSRPYDPTPGPYGQSPYNPSYPSHNSHRPSPLPNSQYPYNTTNFPPHSGSGYRPANGTIHNFSQTPSYYNPGHNMNPVIPFNSTYQHPPYNYPQYPFNNYTRPSPSPHWPGAPSNRPYNTSHGQYPQYSNSNPQYPTHSRNSTYNNIPSQRPPYYPGQNGQYPSPNGQYPSPNGQYPTPNGQYPSPNGQYPTPNGQYPTTNGRYPSSGGPYPTPNGQYPNKNGQYYPTSNGQFQGNNNFTPNYPSSNTTTGYRFTNSFTPSIPNYPPHNNDRNNFYYPQRNGTEYDPRKTPPEQFSYHH